MTIFTPAGEVITNLIRESRRVLRQGGVLLFSDNNPASKTIQVQQDHPGGSNIIFCSPCFSKDLHEKLVT